MTDGSTTTIAPSPSSTLNATLTPWWLSEATHGARARDQDPTQNVNVARVEPFARRRGIARATQAARSALQARRPRRGGRRRSHLIMERAAPARSFVSQCQRVAPGPRVVARGRDAVATRRGRRRARVRARARSPRGGVRGRRDPGRRPRSVDVAPKVFCRGGGAAHRVASTAADRRLMKAAPALRGRAKAEVAAARRTRRASKPRRQRRQQGNNKNPKEPRARMGEGARAINLATNKAFKRLELARGLPGTA